MAAKSYVFKEGDLIKPPVNIENPNHLKRFLDDLTNKLNANSFFTYPIVNGYTGTLPINYLSYIGREVNGMLEAAARVDALSGTVKNYITESLQTEVLQNTEDLAVVTQQFGTFYDDATAAAWYGLTVKTGELISGFTVGGLDTDTTTPGTAGSFFAISADKFTVGRALEDIDDPAELAYAQANNLPYGTMYDADLGQVIPAFLIEWNGTSYDIFFNGKVQFTNVAGTETLLSDVSSALQEAQSKNVVFYQTSAPIATKINDLWFDTDNNYKMYVWDGTTWVNATGDAATAINSNTTTINGAKITTGSITASQIAANTIVANNIAAGTITGAKIAASTITGTNIAADAITADKINVTTLSAISADIGTITAGTINAAVVNAGVLNLAQIPQTTFFTSDNVNTKTNVYMATGSSQVMFGAYSGSSTSPYNFVANKPVKVKFSFDLKVVYSSGTVSNNQGFYVYSTAANTTQTPGFYVNSTGTTYLTITGEIIWTPSSGTDIKCSVYLENATGAAYIITVASGSCTWEQSWV